MNTLQKIKTENVEKAVKLGVIGFGRGKGFMEIATEQFENVIPAAICDIAPEKREDAKRSFSQALVFENIDDMIAGAEFDALIVETPADYHAEICGKALKAGIHVLSDIPCVDSVQEGEELYNTVKNSDAIYMSGANPNFRPTTQALMDVKEKGLLGKASYVETEYIHDLREYYDVSPWRIKYPPIKYCTHSLGPVLELIDEEFEYVSCFGTGSHILGIDGQQDTMSALLRTKSNVVVRLLVSFVNNYHGGGHFIRVFGTEGSAIIHPVSGEFKLHSTKTRIQNSCNMYTDLDILKTLPQYAKRPKSEFHGGTDYALVDKFLTAVRTGSPSPIPIEKALRMCLPGIYAHESALDNGNLKKIDYPWSQ